MKKLFYLTSILFLFSCASQHEQKAIEELSNTYGGEISISNGVNSSTDNGTIKYKRISVNNSSVYEKGLVDPELLASNYAITFFDKIENSDKDFDKLEIELNKNDGTTYTYELSKDYLETIKDEYKILNNWKSELKNNNIESAYKFLQPLSPNLPTYDEYLETNKKLSEKFGQIDSVLFDGYYIIESTDSSYQGKIHQFVYTIKGKNGAYGMSAQMIPTDKNLKIHGLALDVKK